MGSKIIDDLMAQWVVLSYPMGGIGKVTGANARMARVAVSTASQLGELSLAGLDSSGAGVSATTLSARLSKRTQSLWFAPQSGLGSVFGRASGQPNAVFAALVARLAKKDHHAADLDLDLTARA